MVKKKGIICLLALFSVLTAKAQSPSNKLDSAQNLFNQYQLAQSSSAYQQIADNSSNDITTRIKAYVKLAGEDWRYYNDYTNAMLALKVADNLKKNDFSVNLLSATINQESGKYKEALTYGKFCLNLAGNENEKIEAGLAFAHIVHDINFNQRANDKALNRQNLQKASTLINQILEKQPGNSDASELLIGIGLFLKDGPTIIKAWKSYYLISDEKAINQAIQPGFVLLKPVLIKWHGQQLSATEMKQLAIGLADSKFFDYAGWVANTIRKQSPSVYSGSKSLQDIVAYADYIKGMEGVNSYIYPLVARGKKNYDNEYDSLMDKQGKVFWNKASFINKGQKFDPDTLYNILNRKYGMEGYYGTTVNYYGMLMGHIIHKELKQINQYGYSTKFTYISVDRLISRDFTSWYGTTNVGGWGDSTTIIQVRKAYMTEPFLLLSLMTDTIARKAALADIEKQKQLDFERCKNNPYTEPKFLSPYIKFNEASKIYQHLLASGLKGTELNIAFVDEIFKLTIASTVFAHEGRHAIDQLYFPKEFKTMSDDERELRAKFSEVIFSLNPKMAFTGSILGSDLDENTNHGKANQRFRKIIVDWMSTHQDEIKALDTNVPLLMQFDLLTDAQLIAICKSADPFAKG